MVPLQPPHNDLPRYTFTRGTEFSTIEPVYSIGHQQSISLLLTRLPSQCAILYQPSVAQGLLQAVQKLQTKQYYTGPYITHLTHSLP